MTTQTLTSIELEPFDSGGSKLAPQVPPTLLALPPISSDGQPELVARIRSEENATTTLPRGRSIIVITQLAGINFITSFSNGLVTVGLPAMSTALGLSPSLMLWPMNSYALVTASCLLIAGAVADIVGTRKTNLTGCFIIALFILVSGFSNTGIQLILFRAMQGIGGALALPSSMSIISRYISSGKPRNIGFACLGLAQPLGFSFGLVLGGIFIDMAGWRVGFYIGGAASFLLFTVGIWALPKDVKLPSQMAAWKRLLADIDWIGAGLASTAIALFSYVLATLAADIENIRHASNICFLVLSGTLIALFIVWMRRQKRRQHPALIPNSLWNNTSFTTICLLVLLSNAVVNCMELFSSLFFQEVQDNTALETSLKILPNMILGIVTNFSTGLFVNKMPAMYAVLITSTLCAVAPLLMAVINTSSPYWYNAFFAQLLSPLSVDVLFTVGILIISDVFPTRTQALAGAVFNTLAQLGTSIGLTTTSVISVAVTKGSGFHKKQSPEALMLGYRASFWTLFAWMATACIIGAFGLRKVGRVGQKRD